MPLAQTITKGVGLANVGGQLIPELGVETRQLDDVSDIHFGMNGTTAELTADLDMTIAAEADLDGFGARAIDIKRRGGRTAEDDWFVFRGFGRSRQRAVGDTDGMTQARFDTFNNVPIKNQQFPAHARLGNVAVGGDDKYPVGSINKRDAEDLEYGTRWSKTALENALARGQGYIHFHLDGMGDLAGIFDKTGDYGYNVTSRELRYVKRFWQRFQAKVIFYNGYNGALNPVRVQPPWLPNWMPNTPACSVCALPFSRINPVRWPHHCRICGLCVCDNCSPHRHPLRYPVRRPGSDSSPYRVCTPCNTAFVRAIPAPI